jgi:hypothetical protein
VPAGAAVTALVLVLINRVGGPVEISQSGPWHAGVQSVIAALSDPRRLFALTDGSWARSLAILVVAWAGLACCLRDGAIGKASASQLLALTAGQIAGAFLILASAYYQFGEACCQRHETFRGCLIVLATLTLAALVARSMTRNIPSYVGPVLLTAALLLGLIPRIPLLIADYRQIPAVIAVRHANWVAGHEPGPAMVFLIAPAPHVVNSDNLPVRGRFVKAANNPWFIAGLLRFFEKNAVEIRDP